MVELRHLTYFKTVAELGSIAKAAAALHMTQPTLSRQIAQLERSVGYELLQRGPQGASLTPAGAGFQSHIDTIFRQIDRIPDVLRTSSKNERLIHVGIPAGVPGGWFIRCQEILKVGAPPVRLSLHEATSDEQRRLLQLGLIDVGLLHAEPAELHSAAVLKQQFGCTIRDRNVLAGRDRARLSDLDGLTVMAHSVNETPGEESLLRAAATVGNIDIQWVFRRFSAHGELIAEVSGADVVLLSAASAAKHLPHWGWVPFASTEPISILTTWAAWTDSNSPGVHTVIDAMRQAAELQPR